MTALGFIAAARVVDSYGNNGSVVDPGWSFLVTTFGQMTPCVRERFCGWVSNRIKIPKAFQL